MKKTYINPTITVVKIQTVGMLAESGPNPDIKNEGGINTPGGMDSRYFDFDDEEEY